MALSPPNAKPLEKIFLFGDQAYSTPKRDLKRLLDDSAFQQTFPDPSSPFSLFIHRCGSAIQRDLAQFINPMKVKHLCPSGTLADMLLQWHYRNIGYSHPHYSDRDDAHRCLALDMALLVAYQVLLFIRHVESSPSAEHYGNATVIGTCTGALAAAAVGCSADLAELVPLGIEAVRVAFRVGLVVDRAARDTAPATGTKQPWSMAVSAADERTFQGMRVFLQRLAGKVGNTASSWLQKVDNRKREARKGSYWVSAWGPNSVTVSGPPEVLAELADSDGLAVPGVRILPIPIFGPFHSSLLHTKEDVARLLAFLDPAVARTPACLTVISASTGEAPEEAVDFVSLMRTAVNDMLLRPLRWDLVLQRFCEHAEASESGTGLPEVISIASSAGQSLNTALSQAQKGTRKPRKVKDHGLESTTIHRIVTEADLMVGDGLYLVTEADLARPDLREAVQGHLVEGKRLCTPSVFADIAMTLGNYLVEILKNHERKHTLGAHKQPAQTHEYLVTIADLSVSKALVAENNGPGSQLLQCHAYADWTVRTARCKFAVVSRSGKPQQHAECTIRITDVSILSLFHQYSSGESHCINVSSLRSRPGTTHISGSMAYRVVSSLAEFHRNHRLVQSLVLDQHTHEIAALVRFPGDLSGHGDYTAHPAIIDAFTQPAGFCLNLDDATDLEHTVYINHGWEDMLLFEAIDMGLEYTVYVRMQQVGRTRKWTGDIIVLREDNIVAAFLQYSVNAFPRRVFSNMLSQETKIAEKMATTSSRVLQTAVPCSPPQTPKPPKTLRIQTKPAGGAGQGIFPPSPLSPDDMSRKGPSVSPQQNQQWLYGGDSPAMETSCNATPRSFDTSLTIPDVQTQDKSSTIPIPPCKSVILQGFPKTAHTILFLFPDGSGSATSYAFLPPVGVGVCVIGLMCPFLRGDTATMAHAINESVRARLTKAKLADQLAGWYPFATCDTMAALTSFQVWMFIIDDLLDQYSLPQRFDYAALQILLADCRDFIQQSLGLSQKCDNDGYEYRDHDAVTSFKEYAGAVMKTFGDNHAYRSRIAREAIATLDGYRHEAMNRHQGRVPSLEEYLGYRAASSCIMQVVVNFEFANTVHMPEDVMKTPEMCRLYESAVAICFILNDIVSLRKEIKEGFVENLVVLLADGDVQRGVDGAAARMQLEVYALDDAAEKATRRFKGTPHEKDIEVLVNNCKNMCRTSWLWSVRTPRYCLADITPDAEGGWVFVVDAMA
ncbi:Non-reducing polyketide synthase fsr1 [Colletotrichum tropicale]|nr:Non-reducing polyketide synthase fsr1 [Colletotrichum tropicale]